jgi:ankyrin repeat protein
MSAGTKRCSGSLEVAVSDKRPRTEQIVLPEDVGLLLSSAVGGSDAFLRLARSVYPTGRVERTKYAYRVVDRAFLQPGHWTADIRDCPLWKVLGVRDLTGVIQGFLGVRHHKDALAKAAVTGNDRVLAACLGRGKAGDWVRRACTTASISVNTTMHLAASCGHTHILKELIRSRAGDPCTVSSYSDTTVLYAAVDAGHAETARYLIAEGADVNAYGGSMGATPLYAAIKNEDATLVSLLLDAGADPLQPCNAWDSRAAPSLPVTLAASVGSLAIFRRLHEAGVDIVDTRDVRGETPLMLAASWAEQNDVIPYILEACPDKKAAVQACCQYGDTALDRAISSNNKTIVRLLLDSGASPNGNEVASATPLFTAARFGFCGIVKVLLSAGADPNIITTRGGTWNGWTALSVALAFGQEKAARILLESGADPNLVLDEHLNENPFPERMARILNEYK